MRIVTNEQMKIAEQKAACNGMDFLCLMENAGLACAVIIKERLLNNRENKLVAIVCGNGKNGGDGFVIARKLCESGCTVIVVLASGNPKDKDAAEMFSKLKTTPVRVISLDDVINHSDYALEKAEIIVDAVFGTGFYGSPNKELSALFRLINSCDSFKAAIDIPSGVACDNGEVPGECIKADITIAVSALKPLHVIVPGSLFCGEVIVADIGISESCYDGIEGENLFTLNEIEIGKYFKPFNPCANKGDFGHVLSICGSRNMQGAAVIAAKGALYSGAGLVTAAFPDCAYAAIGAKLTEPLLLPLNSNDLGTFSVSAIPKILKAAKKADVVLIGCGIGQNSDTREILGEVISNTECPVVIDADGINIISNEAYILKNSKKTIVITPHPGEMARLTGLDITQVQKRRVALAREFSQEYQVTVVLKGANTVIAEPDKHFIYVNSTGNPGMATGGSGDLLAGILASFIAQGMLAGDAARAAVFIHGLTGDGAAKRLSKHGLTPSACMEDLPAVMSRFEF